MDADDIKTSSDDLDERFKIGEFTLTIMTPSFEYKITKNWDQLPGGEWMMT